MWTCVWKCVAFCRFVTQKPGSALVRGWYSRKPLQALMVCVCMCVCVCVYGGYGVEGVMMGP